MKIVYVGRSSQRDEALALGEKCLVTDGGQETRRWSMLPGRETTNISGNRFLFLSALSVPTAVLKLGLGSEQTMCWGPSRVSSVL